MQSVKNSLTQNNDFVLSEYHYKLPIEAIAQIPADPRDSSRLLVVNSPTTFSNKVFSQLTEYLLPEDLLVLNDTRVIPARLYGRKVGGALVEILLLEEVKANCWLALVKPGKRFKLGSEIIFSQNLSEQDKDSAVQLKATVIGHDEATGGRILQFDVPSGANFWSLIEGIGEMPLPPYITSRDSTAEQYQTIFAKQKGAVAAPTAGLHFTEQLFTTLKKKGVNTAYITLHVGVGTFRPVETAKITDHDMHYEWVEVNEETISKINTAKAKGGRIFAVGTTAVRALEATAHNAIANKLPELAPFTGKTNLFIYPGYEWQLVDGLITNFHLPESSLLMLVSALIGRERLLSLYREAIANNYRFYSFGDAMLILPEARVY